MRGLLGMVAFFALTGCGGSSAEVDGSAGGVTFGDTHVVFFGGPYIILSMLDLDCEDLAFVRRNYEIGMAPTDADTQLLQFSFDEDNVAEGLAPVDIDAAVSASVIKVAGGAFYESIASAGLLTVDSVDEEESATGSFEGIVFDDGTLTGSFDATWCRNLKAR